MRNIIIVEDETIAADHLQRLLADVMPDAHVAAVLQSIAECVEFFGIPSNVQRGTIVFMDIHLADGPAFRIFERVDIPCPIIFTTAYDQYALDAFKVNSVDYLLKPISSADLQRALSKIDRLEGGSQLDLASLVESISLHQSTYKRTFLIPMGDKLVPLRVDDIACICVDDGITRVLMSNGAPSMSLDEPLDAIMERLDPSLFFRANRQYIVAHSAISEISLWPIGKLALTLSIDTPQRIIVSKARVPEFKSWYTGV